LLHRLGKHYEKPAFELNSTVIGGIDVPVAEEVALSKPFCRLLHFKRLLPDSLALRAPDPKVLIVAPLSGHHATLLRDTVRAMLPEHDVWITDWIDARQVPLTHGPFHLDDYVDYVREFIRLLGPDVHVISVCQPTVPVLAAVSLMASDKDPALPHSMTMMGGPIDSRRSPTAVNALAMTKPYSWFENHVIFKVPSTYPGYLRRVYPGFLQHAGFVAMNPDRHMTSHWDFYLDLVKGDGDDADAHRKFYDEYNAVLDLPAEYYLDTIKIVFQEHRLPSGTWHVRGQRVAPEDIKTVRLFTIEGELDDISGSGQTQAAHDLCNGIPKSKKQHLTAAGAGHYGIFSGRRWREHIYPRIRHFIRAEA
jgi:poly(3-hydroxybutyrate) depolymerase